MGLMRAPSPMHSSTERSVLICRLVGSCDHPPITGNSEVIYVGENAGVGIDQKGPVWCRLQSSQRGLQEVDESHSAKKPAEKGFR